VNVCLELLAHLARERLLGRFPVLGSTTWQGPKRFVVGAMQQDRIVVNGYANDSIVESAIVPIETNHHDAGSVLRMSHNGRVAGRDVIPAELQSPQLKRLRNVQRLGTERSGHASVDHVRHQLYVGRDLETNGRALLKVTTRPGIVYEQNLVNEAAVLSTINNELPASRHFPLLLDHGRVRDGRMFVLMSFFDEWPLATTIGGERRPDRLVGYLRTSLAVGTALATLHRIGIVHVDLNPMNILYRADRGIPIVRIVDFESSYEIARHGKDVPYSPPTTTGFSAPEVSDHAPDGRADVFSLGAVLFTMIAGYQWTLGEELSASIAADREIDGDLQTVLLTAVDRTPARRHQSVEIMCAAIEGYLESIWPARS
jgi:serine/threonine protein kinase